MTTFDLESWMERHRALVDETLAEVLPSADGNDPERLREGMRYGVLNGGKRMRPLLCLAAAEAAGGPIARALPSACALEMVHAYSLVHDDLPAMDNDLERRGKPTVHVAFGEANAILIGDALLTLAFQVVARGAEGVDRAHMAEAVVRLAHHSGIDGMVGGQAEDLALGQEIADLEALEHVHALKTGGLYASAGALGALCVGAGPEQVADLERFGLCFGIAFQHADDILDDDQQTLRAEALKRVEALVAECRAIGERFGERAQALMGVVAWLEARTRRAASGAKFE